LPGVVDDEDFDGILSRREPESGFSRIAAAAAVSS